MKSRYAVLFCVLLMAACSHSPSKKYYLLSAAESPPPAASDSITQTVGVGPIEVADYLNRLRMVYLVDSNSLDLADNDYWAEPLEKGIARVITLNLISHNPQRGVIGFPWRSDSKPNVSVRLQVHEFVRRDNQAQLTASWAIFDNRQRVERVQRHFSASINCGQGAAALASAFSQLLRQLSDEMNAAIDQLPVSATTMEPAEKTEPTGKL